MQGLLYEVEEAEGLQVPGFDWEVEGARTPSDPLGKEGGRCIEKSRHPLESLEAVEGVEGQRLLLTLLVASPEEQERWQICQRPQWEGVRGISAVVVMVHAVQVQVPLARHCELFVMEVEAGEHLVDYQSCCRCSGD